MLSGKQFDYTAEKACLRLNLYKKLYQHGNSCFEIDTNPITLFQLRCPIDMGKKPGRIRPTFSQGGGEGWPFGKNSHKIPFRTHWLSTLRSYFHLWKPVLQFTGKVLGKNIGDKSSTEKVSCKIMFCHCLFWSGQVSSSLWSPIELSGDS